MENEKIIEVLSDWNFWTKNRDTGICREKYVAKLEKFIHTEQVVAITGVRRSGKSTLMRQFIKRKIDAGEKRPSFLYVNFEEPRFAGLLSLDFLQQIFEAYEEIIKPTVIPYILLDEVQNVPNWERFVRGLSERKAARIIISGSTSRLLSRELGTLLTGRWIELRVYPLDFAEFLQFKGVTIESKLDMLSKKTKIKQLLREYLEFGGFPLVALKDEKKEILRGYFEDIVARDIGERHRIRELQKLKTLGKYYLTNFSSMISYRKIATFIGLSLDTVERMSDYMEEAFLLFFMHKFSYSFREQEINPRKIYCVDHGLTNIVSFRFSDNIGRLYENAVFLHFIRKGNEVYYYKNKKECDFAVKEGKRVTCLVQVCYNLEGQETKKREIDGLIESGKKLKCRNLLVITEETEGSERVGGKTLKYIPLWKWLLEA